MADKKNGIRISQNGSIRIDGEVIAAIAYLAAVQAPGVAAEAPKVDFLQNRTLKSSLLKGIKIKFLQEGLEIDIQISVEQGIPPILAAKSVQTRVRTDVENMTGMRIQAVNVNVSSIRL
jgi:uncharacterized alkaline shock family protein YloU